MRLTATPLAGVVVVDLERQEDDRGFFARAFDRQQFADAGLMQHVEQVNVSSNAKAGTVRGLHWQVAPAAEAKLVRCTRGGVLDQVVDLRPDSATYLQSFAIELTGENRSALHVPPLVAHGFQTLVDDTELTYLMSEAYTPGTDRGLRYDDPALGLTWPLPVTALSDRDAAWPLLLDAAL